MVVDVNGIKVSFSAGNSKLGYIPNFNLTPGTSCSPAACATCHRDGCYACKAYRQYPNVRRAWDANTDAALCELAALEIQLDAWLSRSRKKYIRVHSAGDFITADYAAMWTRLAARHPEKRFLAFTKQYSFVRGLDIPENMSVVPSHWRGIDMPEDINGSFPTAHVFDAAAGETAPAGCMTCPGSCKDCKSCWHLKELGVNVAFAKH